MKKIVSLLLLILMLFITCSCSKLKEKTGMLFLFDTEIKITIRSNNDVNQIYDDVVKIFNVYNDLSNRYKQSNMNNVYTINNSDDFVEVDERLVDLLKEAIKYQNDTNGFFNPLIGNISDIYKEIIKNKDLTNMSKIEDELLNMNNSAIIIENNKVKIDGSATIDLGGIAKGYAVKKAVEYLKEKGVSEYLISAGYSSIGLGEKQGDEYRVGLKYDENKVLNLKNIGIGSCSMHEQNVEIDGKVYHHIVNPLTGMNENKYTTVYLIGEDSSMIDAYTTAFFNMDIFDIKIICEKENLKYLIYVGDVLTYYN